MDFDDVPEIAFVVSGSIYLSKRDQAEINAATVSVSYTNSNIVTHTVNKAYTHPIKNIAQITFNERDVEGSTDVTITVTCGGKTYTVPKFSIQVYSVIPTSYTVEAVDGASYGFTLDSDGYYVSTNKGMNDSASVCKVTIENNGGANVYVDCIQSSEYNYDYGILSNVGQTLSTSSTADNTYFKSFKGTSSTDVQTVNYGAISGFIYIKYRKDSSAANGTDSFKFKIRFE